MRRTFWILLPLFASLLAPTGAWEASVSQNISITITAAATQPISFTPESLTFASQAVGTTSPPQTVTITNVSGAPLPIYSISTDTVGNDLGDFVQTNSCTSPMPVGGTCPVSITFTPTATGTRSTQLLFQSVNGGPMWTMPITGTGTSNLAAAFYVATNGSDSNPGTLAAPFATLGKCQTTIQNSNIIKTCYIRAGTYQLSGSGITLTSSDNGERWSYYPPDGLNTATIQYASSVGSCGGEYFNMFYINGASNIVMDGLNLDGGVCGGSNGVLGIGGQVTSAILIDNSSNTIHIERNHFTHMFAQQNTSIRVNNSSFIYVQKNQFGPPPGQGLTQCPTPGQCEWEPIAGVNTTTQSNVYITDNTLAGYTRFGIEWCCDSGLIENFHVDRNTIEITYPTVLGDNNRWSWGISVTVCNPPAICRTNSTIWGNTVTAVYAGAPTSGTTTIELGSPNMTVQQNVATNMNSFLSTNLDGACTSAIENNTASNFTFSFSGDPTWDQSAWFGVNTFNGTQYTGLNAPGSTITASCSVKPTVYTPSPPFAPF